MMVMRRGLGAFCAPTWRESPRRVLFSEIFLLEFPSPTLIAALRCSVRRSVVRPRVRIIPPSKGAREGSRSRWSRCHGAGHAETAKATSQTREYTTKFRLDSRLGGWARDLRLGALYSLRQRADAALGPIHLLNCQVAPILHVVR